MSAINFPSGPPSGLFGMRSAAAFQKDPLSYIIKNSSEYGDIVYHRFGPYHAYMLNAPGVIHEVLVKKANSFYKWDMVKKVMGKVTGNGILTSDGEHWKRQRKLVQPSFHTRRIQSYADVMVDYTLRRIETWQDGSEVDIAHEMMEITMGIIAKTAFDVDVTSDASHIGEEITVLQHMMMLEMVNIIHAPDWLPTPRNLRENRAMRELKDYLMKIITERRASGEDRGDLLSALLMAEDEDGNRMSDDEVYDEVVTLFIAGHETTANALAWMWYLLAQHPDVEHKLYDEVQSVLQGRAPTLDDLEKMAYTNMVFDETLRVYPTIWIFHRQAIEDVQVGDWTIPKGALVYVSPWGIHHDERYWDDPMTFNPERFSPERKKAIQPYTYFPFGGGPRVCVGNHFAMMEAEIITSTIMEHFRFELVPGQEIVPETLIALRPKDGIKMRVHRRT